jgi:3-oxoacyl-[acyl-carrier protein] reductase
MKLYLKYLEIKTLEIECWSPQQERNAKKVNKPPLGHSDLLDGQVAIVTGASGNFGAAIAERLAGAGACIALVGRQADRLRHIAARLPEHTAIVEADVSRAGEADRIVAIVEERFGHLDILVNNAGGATVGGLLALTEDEWKQDIDLKLLGYMRLMRASALVMRNGRGGRIVNVIGLAGHEPYHLLTSASVVNAGLLALTKTAADELAGANIRVNAVNPNAASTGLGDRMIIDLARAQGTTPEAVRSYLVSMTPLKRLAEPEDVAAAVLFYASNMSTFMTGSSLTVDGGAHRAVA